MCKRIKVWFHNVKERVVDKVGDHRDYWVYQKKYWHHSNFFIFLNWLSRDRLRLQISEELYQVHKALEWVDRAQDICAEGYRTKNAELFVRAEMVIGKAGIALERVEKARNDIFKI